MFSSVFAIAQTRPAYCKENWLWACGTFGTEICPTPPPSSNPAPTRRAQNSTTQTEPEKRSLTELMRMIAYCPRHQLNQTPALCVTSFLPNAPRGPGEVRLKAVLGLEWLLREKAVNGGWIEAVLASVLVGVFFFFLQLPLSLST